jgi:hypothetical protein
MKRSVVAMSALVGLMISALHGFGNVVPKIMRGKQQQQQ